MKKFMESAFKYLHSERGRRHILFAAGGGAGIVAWSYVASQTFFIERYRNVVQLYKNGLVTPVGPEVLSRSEQVLDDMNLGAKSRAYIRFFAVFGFDPYFLGSTKTRRGAYIGIPSNFEYNSARDVERGSIRVGGSPVSWNTDEGRLLQEGIILSENAQKFAIAREIARADTHHLFVYSGIHTTSILLYTMLAQIANEKFYGLYKPASFRITVYSLIGTFIYGVWAVSRDILTKYYENYSDKRASSLGINYAKGGVEFYTRIIQRNIALRGHMGSDGESLYTQFGNDVEMIRQKHVPFSVRKRNAEEIVKNYYGKAQVQEKQDLHSLQSPENASGNSG